ncbi:MAG: xanthine dehydrogenase family protein subunit M [Actinomycetota bacterium]|nr:xanthine dehydrogenase family protein subunit M [Actinomycetota bacterium]
MKPSAFEYHLAVSTDEAVGLLAEHDGDAKVIAGGQSLVPLLALRLARVDHLVDINKVPDLQGITANGGLRIGAMTRHREAERSALVRRHAPLLADALTYIGHAAIRNRGTLGGSLAHADPAAELPATLLALDGQVEVRNSRGTRTVAAADLFTGFLTTSLEPDELLTAISLPAWRAGSGWSVQEFARRSGDFAISGAMTVLSTGADGRIDDARIALIGVAPTAVRASAAEQALIGGAPSEELWASVAEAAVADIEPPSDLHGSSAYRKKLTSTLVRRSLAESASRIGAAA